MDTNSLRECLKVVYFTVFKEILDENEQLKKQNEQWIDAMYRLHTPQFICMGNGCNDEGIDPKGNPDEHLLVLTCPNCKNIISYYFCSSNCLSNTYNAESNNYNGDYDSCEKCNGTPYLPIKIIDANGPTRPDQIIAPRITSNETVACRNSQYVQ